MRSSKSFRIFCGSRSLKSILQINLSRVISFSNWISLECKMIGQFSFNIIFWRMRRTRRRRRRRRRRSSLRPRIQERKFSPKRKFLAGYPCGHPAKNFGQAIQILEKNKHFGTDIPRGRPSKKLRSEKLRANFPFCKNEFHQSFENMISKKLVALLLEKHFASAASFQLLGNEAWEKL